MNKEMVISATPHETRVAILEDDQVVEIFIEREHSRGVVGNIYKGRVSKVLPGMQSAFVDLGLERDAFLYVTDVISPTEEALEDEEEIVPAPVAEPDGSAVTGEDASRLRQGREIVLLPHQVEAFREMRRPRTVNGEDASLLDVPEARATLVLSAPANAVGAIVRAQAATDGATVPNSPFGNVLTLTLT